MTSLSLKLLLVAVQLTLLVIENSAQLLSRARTFAKTNETYSDEEWKKLIKSMQPKISDHNFNPIKQPAGSGKLSRNINGQIIGGVDAALGQFPWQVGMNVDRQWFCGGSLIMKNWVLTAAHCVGSSYDVKIGTIVLSSLSSGGVLVTSTVSFKHEQYNDNTLKNDIALVKLPQDVTFTDNIKPVALPPASDASTTFEKTLATVSGFGLTSDTSASVSDTMKFVDVTVISNVKCTSYYGSTITSSHICTQQESKSTCQGDSGGPLVYKNSFGTWVQIGVVSFGSSDGCLAAPSGFTRVASYLNWIAGKLDGTSTSVGTTNKPGKTTKPPKCHLFNFEAMAKCCGGTHKELVIYDRTDKTCNAKAANFKIFNSYTLNKQQKSNNNVNLDDKTKKALGKDACFVNCYLGANKAAFSNGTVDSSSALITFLTKKLDANSVQASIVTSAVNNCYDIFNGYIPNFINGKSLCDGTALIIVQCVQFSLISLCTDKLTTTKCKKDQTNFDACANYVINTQTLNQKIKDLIPQMLGSTPNR